MLKSNPPAFLYCLPEIYLVNFTKLLSLRSFHGTGPTLLRLQDWESVLNCINLLSRIISYALQTRTGQFPLLTQFFEETLRTFDWKSQLLWYNIARDLTRCTLTVPKCFFQITGALDDLFICDEDTDAAQESEGWHEIFMACKLSTKLSDELFMHAEQWTYNLLLLWNHPYEDTIIKSSLFYALHPSTSLSVSLEYPNLILNFLGKLYDSYAGVHEVIREFNGYEQQDMIPIIQDLSDYGTRQYFIILYITLLLKNNMTKTEGRDEKQDDYYVACLIKVLQGMENWGDISPPPLSYSNLKTRIIKSGLIRKIHQETSEDPSPGNMTGANVPTEPKVVHYPLLDTPEFKSQRALSIICFYHLCSLFKDHEISITQKQALERLIILIMEGFIDTSSRQEFHRMLAQQPKKRITTWRKKKCEYKFVMTMRPAVTSAEEKLLRPVIVETIPNHKRIIQALKLSPKNHNTKSTKPNYLYFNN
ncbi:uncharacterized protein EV154DRAFT_201619 [Mucor mucedo]|uniref:uncharacterized protein n=1 Tax=Mucor mucedo TaxID=29922 RepID=UPI00221EFB5E|nr:uncharacterized protein EV154DRAFT_201619 [Mucor mucedo]KAI7892213.1 hypothetical protein EV154DRAFT_201619 [Mucor mucedo]